MSQDFSRYVEYIKNCGEKCLVLWFDEDWEPVGPMVRCAMAEAGLIEINNCEISLKTANKSLDSDGKKAAAGQLKR